MGGVEYQVTKVDPTDPETKGMVYQVHKVSEEVAATLGGKVYRARIIKDPSDPAVAGKVYQIVLIGDPDDPAVKGKVYNAILTGGSEAVVVGPAVSPLALDDAIADTMEYVKAYGGTEQRSLPQGYQQLVSLTTDNASYFDADYIINSFDVDVTIDATVSLLASGPNMLWGFMGAASNLPRWGVGTYQNNWLMGANATQSSGAADTNRHVTTGVLFYNENDIPCYKFVLDGAASTTQGTSNAETIIDNTLSTFVGARNNRGTAGNFNPSTIYSFKIKKAGELVVNMVPAKRLSDNVVGFYDTVRDRFFTNAGTGTITADDAAVPTPDYPMNIVTNNGVLKARHQSGLPLGYTLLEYIESSGTQYIDTGIKVTQNDRVEVRYCYHENSSVGTSGRIAGGRYTSGSPRDALALGSQNGKADPTTNMFSQFGTGGTAYAGPRIVIGDWFTAKSSADGYYVNDTAYQAPIPTDDFETPYTVKLFAFEQSAPGGDPTIGCGVGRCADFKIYTNNVLMMDLVPAKNSSNVIGMYDLVSGQFFTNQGTGTFTAGNTVSDPVEIYTDGTVETIKDSLNNTATAEMLLKVGDYQDVQSIIDGVVTRNVGVKVLDGTENWAVSGSNRYWLEISNMLIGSNYVRLCTHFKQNTVYANLADGEFFCGGSTTRFNIRNDATPTTEQLKQWLADQYAAGTPVIIVYPLATPTTETVTGQTLQVQDGDNTLEITQASLDGLQLEAEYEKEAD